VTQAISLCTIVPAAAVARREETLKSTETSLSADSRQDARAIVELP
jgi:hypothetical protein